MKKRLLTFALAVACAFSLTACGGASSEEVTENDYMTAEEAVNTAASATQIYVIAASEDPSILSYFNQNMPVMSTVEEYTKFLKQQDTAETDAILAGVESYIDAKEELGSEVKIKTLDAVEGETPKYDAKVKIKGDEIVVNLTLEGNKVYKEGKTRTATQEVIIKKNSISSISTTVDYELSEAVSTAGLNTLLGMGTVFCILILIAFCIWLMGVIVKAAQNAGKEKVSDVKAEAVDNTVADIITREEAADDSELVAVIAAAIAASEGTSTDGFVVRSIIRKA